MFLDLDESQGEWFEFFSSRVDPSTGETIYDDPAKDARVKIRSMGAFFEGRMAKRKKEVERVLNPKSRAMERLVYVPELSFEDEMAERDDAWDYAIVDFEGFKDSNTKEVLVCDRETKLKLMKNPVFDRFVGRCLQIISSSGVQEKEDLEKNL